MSQTIDFTEINDYRYLKLRLAQHKAYSKVSRKQIPATVAYLENNLKTAELSDSLVLLRMIKKEIKEHNARIQSTIAKINSLRYQSATVFESKMLRGVNLAHIEKIIRENPEYNYDALVCMI